MADEIDVSLPKATIVKLIKEFSGDMRVGSETTDMLLECCTEFIQLLASECNEVSTKDKKNTITPDHVIKALEELGFSEFTDEVKGALQQFKDETKSAPKLAHRKTKAETEGLSEEEQIALQQQLFAAARMRSQGAQSIDAAAQAAVAAAYNNLAQQGQLPQQQQQQQQQQHAPADQNTDQDEGVEEF